MKNTRRKISPPKKRLNQEGLYKYTSIIRRQNNESLSTPCLDPDILLGPLLSVNKIDVQSNAVRRCKTPRYPSIKQNEINSNFLERKKKLVEVYKVKSSAGKAKPRLITTKSHIVHLRNEHRVLVKNKNSEHITNLTDKQVQTPNSSKSFMSETTLKTEEKKVNNNKKQATKKSRTNFNKPLDVIIEKHTRIKIPIVEENAESKKVATKNSKLYITSKKNQVVNFEALAIIEAAPERLKQKSRPIFLSKDKYEFEIAEGNNSQLVRKCFECRSHWKEIPTFSNVFNYKWEPISKGIRFELLSKGYQRQMVNHLEGHFEISAKDGLLRNLISYCEGNKQNVFNYIPLAFELDIDSPSYPANYDKFITCYSILNSYSTSVNSPDKMEMAYKWIDKKLTRVAFTVDKRLTYYSRAKISRTQFAGKNLWMLKPTGCNRGRGVSVIDTLKKLESLITLYSNEPLAIPLAKGNTKKYLPTIEIDSSLKTSQLDVSNVRSFIIQKYIERPLLIHQRKFDIRVWVLVTHEMRVYFFKEGYLRTSSELYSTDSETVNNRNIHLTNNAIQKFGNKYGQFEDGNQLSFNKFQVLLFLIT